MLLPIKPLCSAKEKRRDGTSIIYLQYCFSAEKRTLLNTNIAIPSSYWNDVKLCIKNSLPKHYGDYQNLNDDLNRMMRLSQDLVRYADRNAIEDPGVFVKQAFKPNLDLLHCLTMICAMSKK